MNGPGQGTSKRAWTSIARVVRENDLLVFLYAAYGAVLAFLLESGFAPVPFEQLDTIPNWASWFDVYVAFPLLLGLCLLPFRAWSRSGRILAFSVVAVIPIYLVLASYYFFYALVPLGWAVFGIPVSLLVPATILIILLALPLLNSVVTAGLLARPAAARWSWPSGVCGSKAYFSAVGLLSVALAAVQIALRVAEGPSSQLAWTSDVGIGVAAATRDLVTGINPYTHGVPPWGGPAGLIWGPVALVLLTPFAWLPLGWAAHAGAMFYGGLTALGLWACVKRVTNEEQGWRAAWLFLALPTTAWLIESGMALHLVAAALIVWTLWAYYSDRVFLAGLLCGLGLLAVIVPGALLLPLIFAAGTWVRRGRLAIGFVVPVVLFTVVLYSILPTGDATSLAGGTVGGYWQTGYSLNLILSPSANVALRLIPSAALGIWLIYRSQRFRAPKDVFTTCAVFLLLVPFATGFYFPFFYAWQAAAALAALAVQISPDRARVAFCPAMPTTATLPTAPTSIVLGQGLSADPLYSSSARRVPVAASYLGSNAGAPTPAIGLDSRARATTISSWPLVDQPPHALRIALVVPTYNEAQNIGALVEACFLQMGDAAGVEFHIIVVDDNSPDGTGALVRQLAQRHNRLHLLARPRKLGYGTAFLDGYRWAMDNLDPEVFLQMDADFSHPPGLIPALVFGVASGSCDVAVGSRYISGGGSAGWPIHRRLISRMANILARGLLGLRTRDVTGEYRCLLRRAVEALLAADVQSSGYEYAIESMFVLRQGGFRVREFPYIFPQRRAGQTKLRGSDIIRWGSRVSRLTWSRLLATHRRGRDNPGHVA